jgi:DNA polymerase I
VTTIVTDTETNGLILPKTNSFPSVIHCATTVDIGTEEVLSFAQDPDVCREYNLLSMKDYAEVLREADEIVGHNWMKYDRPVIEKHTGYLIPIKKCIDTLIYSKLIEPKRQGGHSLAAWGRFFGQPKPEHEDWTKFSPEMLHRNVEDTHINVKLYHHLMSEYKRIGFTSTPYKVERNLAAIFYEQEQYGFPLDLEFAREVYYQIKDRADELKLELQTIYPDTPDARKTELHHYIPKYKKDSTELHANKKKKLDQHGLPEDTGESTLFKWRKFDPDSNQERIKMLLRHGWTPLEYTDKGNPRITDESLEAYDNEDGSKLKEYVILRNREAVFYRWLDEADNSGHVHAPINQLGTWTHRCSHTHFFGNPPRVQLEKFNSLEEFKNTKLTLDETYTEEYVKESIKKSGEAEIPVKGLDGKFGVECRSAFGVKRDSGQVLVGADASGIQMRAFAHYIEDEEYVKQILSSDIHVYNRDLAGLKSRSSAKTFIYAFLLGAGDYKTGVIYDMDEGEIEELTDEIMSGQHTGTRETLDYGMTYKGIPQTPRNYAIAFKGRNVKTQFIQSIPGLQKFRREAKVGWVTCLDGRRIYVPFKHKKLAALLQSFEACIIKRANVGFHKELTNMGIWFKQCNQIHDEYQIVTEKSSAKIVGETVVKHIIKAGEIYGSRCPLDGEWKEGYSWSETH